MRIGYNVTGAERKALVGAISQELNTPTRYLGAPTFAYEIGGYHVDKTGMVTGEDNRELVANLQGLHSHIPASEEYDTTNEHTTPTAEDEAWAEREMRRMRLENENVPDYSNRGQYGGDEIPNFEDLQLTEREELGLGHERRDPPGEDGMQASDVPEPEGRTYQAELSDPDCPDRMEVFGAEDDEDALRQAYDYCEGEVVLLELFELDEGYNTIRSVEITPRTDRLTIEVPLKGFTPEKLDNLAKLVNAKASLLKAALGADNLPIKQTAETLLFPWFSGTIDEQHTNAYSTLVSLLCKTAIEKKRVTAKEKDIEGSPKYAMRCFLLSLGFIGEEYKAARKILLSRLEGNSSWKNGKKAEVADSE